MALLLSSCVVKGSIFIWQVTKTQQIDEIFVVSSPMSQVVFLYLNNGKQRLDFRAQLSLQITNHKTLLPNHNPITINYISDQKIWKENLFHQSRNT